MKNYTSLVEGALFSAIFAIMLLVFAYVPLVGGIGVYFLPLPITIYAYRNSLRYSVITVVASITLSLMIAPPFAIINAIMASILGASYGTVLRKEYKPSVCFLVIAFVSTMEFVLLEIFAKTALGVPVISPVIDGVKSLLSSVLPYLPYLSDNETLMLFIDSTIENLAFAVFSVIGILNSLIVFSITAIVFLKLRYKMVYLPSVRSGRNGRQLLIAYLLSLLLLIFGFDFLRNQKIIAAIVANFVFIMTSYYWIVGYMRSCEKVKVMKISPLSKAIALLIVILIFLSPAILLLLTTI